MIDMKKFINTHKDSTNGKTMQIIALLSEMQSYNCNNFDQKNLNFENYSTQDLLQNLFLSRLASIEFGHSGWTFCCGSHRNITEETEKEAKQFGILYGEKFGHKIPLASGATSKFMEIINAGYNKSGNASITATFKIPMENGIPINTNVNKEVKYCFTALDFTIMNNFLSNRTAAGVFFEGGIGTTYECFSLLCRRGRIINAQAPMIFFSTYSSRENIIYNLLKHNDMQNKVYAEDLGHLHLVSTAEEAIEILESYDIFQAPQNKEDIQHEDIRKIFSISSDRHI